MQNKKSPGQIAYEAYWKGSRYACADFEVLPRTIKEQWERVAEAVLSGGIDK